MVAEDPQHHLYNAKEEDTVPVVVDLDRVDDHLVVVDIADAAAVVLRDMSFERIRVEADTGASCHHLSDGVVEVHIHYCDSVRDRTAMGKDDDRSPFLWNDDIPAVVVLVRIRVEVVDKVLLCVVAVEGLLVDRHHLLQATCSVEDHPDNQEADHAAHSRQ